MNTQKRQPPKITLALNDELNFYIFSGDSYDQSGQSIYCETYDCWKQIWKQTFRDLKGDDTIFSDSFTRQEKICAIFYREQCAGLLGLRMYDLNYPASREDSIFSSWNSTDIKTLTKDGSRVLVCSNLGVKSEFRGEVGLGVSLKQLLMHLLVPLLHESGCDVLAGTTRCDKSVNKAVYASGACYINRSMMHGVPVDLIGIYRKDVQAPETYHPATDFLWNKRIDLTKTTQQHLLQVAS